VQRQQVMAELKAADGQAAAVEVIEQRAGGAGRAARTAKERTW